MEILLFSANCVLPILLIMAAGYALRRLRVVSDAFVAQANQFCFQVTLPVQLFCNIYRQQPEAGGGRLIGFAVAAVLAVAGLLCLLLPRLERDRRAAASMIQGIFRGNFLLFGLPLALNMFGEEGVLPTALLLPVAIPLYNILAVVILTHFGSGEKGLAIKPMLLGIIRNPLILASLLGILVSFMPFSFPEFLSAALEDIGATATPLALMMLGAQFDLSKLKGNLKKALACTAVRLLLVPGVVVTLAVLLGFRGPELGAIFILFCAPTAVSSYVMAQNMGADGDLAGQLVVLTTIFSGITLFAQTALLKGLSLI